MRPPDPPLDQHLVHQHSSLRDLDNYPHYQEDQMSISRNHNEISDILYRRVIPAGTSVARAASVLLGGSNAGVHHHLDQITMMNERVYQSSLDPHNTHISVESSTTSGNNPTSLFGQESRSAFNLDCQQTEYCGSRVAPTMVTNRSDSFDYATSSANQEASKVNNSAYYSDSYRKFLKYRQHELFQEVGPKDADNHDSLGQIQIDNGSSTDQVKIPAAKGHPYAFLLTNLGKRPLGTKGCPSTKRKKVKRSADTPRRPLTAFNFFFSEEREIILAHLPDDAGLKRANEDNTSSVEAIEKSMVQLSKEKMDALNVKIKANTQTVLDTENEGDRVKKTHRKMHGKIPFQMLSKLVGKRWRSLSLAKKQYYIDLSKRDNDAYGCRMVAYEKMASSSSRAGEGRS